MVGGAMEGIWEENETVGYVTGTCAEGASRGMDEIRGCPEESL